MIYGFETKSPSNMTGFFHDGNDYAGYSALW